MVSGNHRLTTQSYDVSTATALHLVSLDASRLVVQLSSPNPMKPGVKSRMKM